MYAAKNHSKTEEFETNVEAATSTFLIEPYSSLIGPLTNPVLNCMEFIVRRLRREQKLQNALAAQRGSCAAAQLLRSFCKGAKHHIPFSSILYDLAPFHLPLVFQVCFFLLIK
jgi:hypothetical protein